MHDMIQKRSIPYLNREIRWGYLKNEPGFDAADKRNRTIGYCNKQALLPGRIVAAFYFCFPEINPGPDKVVRLLIAFKIHQITVCNIQEGKRQLIV